MIYDFPGPDEPVRQGDIFYPVPLVRLDLSALPVVEAGGGVRQASWSDVMHQGELVVCARVHPVWGVVATQDCDARRAEVLSLFRIDEFVKVTGLTPPEGPRRESRWWVGAITQKARISASWFYLPPDERVGFDQRMAVHFHQVLQVRRSNLVASVPSLRQGRLNAVAFEHCRECIAHYFRRYSYDEWYSLDRDELAVYQAEKGPVRAFEWRK